jgi:hypothetical protein
MKKRRILSLCLQFAVLAVAGSSLAAPRNSEPRPTDKVVALEMVRLPFSAGKVYEVKLMPGAPFALELPAGETARNIWFDNRWWAAESTPGSSRVFLRALEHRTV